MSNKKISQLTPSSTDFQDVDEMEGQLITGVESRKFTGAQLRAVEKAEREAQDNVIEAAIGLNVDGTFIPFSGTNFMDTATTHREAEELLDVAIESNYPPFTVEGQLVISNALVKPDIVDVAGVMASGVAYLIQYTDEAGLHTEWNNDISQPIAIAIGLDSNGDFIPFVSTNFLNPTLSITEGLGELDFVLGDVITAVGLGTDGQLIPFSGYNYLDGAESIVDALGLLDAQIADSPTVLFKQTNTVTIGGAITTLTNILGTGVGSLTISANTLAVGDVIKLEVFGKIITGASNTERTLAFYLGDDFSNVATVPVSINHLFNVNIYMTVRTIGATGSVYVNYIERIDDSASYDKFYSRGVQDVFVVDTTASNTIYLKFNWTTDTGGEIVPNSLEIYQAILTKL